MSNESPSEIPSKLTANECSLVTLLDRAKSGDEEASRVLFERYHHHVVRLIRHGFLRTNDPLRTLLDSDDLSQIAWRRVFDGLRRREVVFESEKEFVGFLLTVTKNTCHKEYRYHVGASKRTINRREALHPETFEKLASQADDPALGAAASDEYWQFLAQLPTERRGRIQAALEKGGFPELARLLGQNEETIKGIISRMQSRWTRRRRKKNEE